MKIKKAALALFKGLLSLNAASAIRGLRSGPHAAINSLHHAYWAADPFETSGQARLQKILARIPEVTVEQAFTWPPKVELDLRHTDVSGSTPLQDMLSLLALAVERQPKAMLEFGTFWGSSTVNLALNLPETTVHTIDLPPDMSEAKLITTGRPVDDKDLIESRQLGKAFLNSPVRSRIVQHAGDTATYDYSVIPDELSFFWVDGSHTYEYAKSDTLVAFHLAKGTCTIAWHDCDSTHVGVTTWLSELVGLGLPVRRIAGTVLAYLKFDSNDPKIHSLLATQV